MTVLRSNLDVLPEIFGNLMGYNYKNHTSTSAMNVIENNDNYVLEIAAPGMTKENVILNLDENNNLKLQMKKESAEQTEKQEVRYLRKDFSYTNPLEQAFILPDDVSKERINAKVENGILYVTLPKFTEEEKQKIERTIAVA